MESAAQEVWRGGEQPYVIPEGGSNGLGSLGYVEAMRETARQLALGLCGEVRRFDLVAHACGSGGTAAGIALGCGQHDVALAVRAFAVCDDAAYFQREVERIVAEARVYEPELEAMAPLIIDDQAKGPRYGQMSDEQLAFSPRRRPRHRPGARPGVHRQGALRSRPGSRARRRSPRRAGAVRAHRRTARSPRCRSGAASVTRS